MKYRTFGKTGEKVSVLGFGCMRFPVLEKDSSKIDYGRAMKMIRTAIDSGVNYIDTAYPYHGGNSEIFLAEALSDGYRDKVLLATKCPSWEIQCYDDFDKYLNEQLKKLNVDHIDFYLLHALNKDRYAKLLDCDFKKFLQRAKEDGRVRHIGFSFHDNYDAFKYIIDDYDGWEFCQIQYNFLDEQNQAGTKGLQYAAQKGLGIVIMEPLRGGSLTHDVPTSVMNLWNSTQSKRTPADWAFSFLWDKSEISVVLSGMSTATQVKQNLSGANKYGEANSLSEDEKQVINLVRMEYEARIKVGCTSCRYCMPCPFGVNIPSNFYMLNMASMHEKAAAIKKVYKKRLKQEELASKCRQCGACEKVCPQKISIREKLKEVSSFFNI